MNGYRGSSIMANWKNKLATVMVLGHLLHSAAAATPPILFTGSPIDTAPILNERHNQAFARPHAHKAYPTRVNTMLSLSSCRPDLNGYFGSVRPSGSGADTTTIRYNLQVTVANMNDQKLDNIVRIVDDSVMDAVLAHAFPNVCAFQLDAQKPSSLANSPSQITGLYFGDVTLHAKESCPQDMAPKSRNGGDPTIHYSCRVLEASLKVFGRYTGDSADAIIAVLKQAINHDAFTRAEEWDAEHMLALDATVSVEEQDDGGFFSGDNPLFTLILAVSGFALLGACVSVWCLYYCRVSKGRPNEIEWKGKPFMGDTVTAASTAMGTSLGNNSIMDDSLVGTVIVEKKSSSSKASHSHHREERLASHNSHQSRRSREAGPDSARKGPRRSQSSQQSQARNEQQHLLRHSTTNTSEISSVQVDPEHGRNYRKLDQSRKVIVEFAESFEDEYPSSEEESQPASAFLLSDRYASPSDGCCYPPPSYLDSNGRYQESHY